MVQNLLTPALEDYLETIYLLQQKHKIARVREIAKDRQVKASSVSLALKRLSELGLIRYEQRERIELTDEGKIAARRVYARHVVLFQFFHNILGMDDEPARAEACGLEHALSNEGLDRFVQFFEMLSMCPSQACPCLTARHKSLSAKPSTNPSCHPCLPSTQCHREACCSFEEGHLHLTEVANGATVTILKIMADGESRQKLLETGLLPNVVIQKLAMWHDKVHILIDGNPIELSHAEAKTILVRSN